MKKNLNFLIHKLNFKNTKILIEIMKLMHKYEGKKP